MSLVQRLNKENFLIHLFIRLLACKKMLAYEEFVDKGQDET
jgi:hypothetical protein